MIFLNPTCEKAKLWFQSLALGSKNRIIYVPLLIIITLFLPVHVFASTVYVATNGSDTNTGSQSSPYRTFSKALSVMHAGDEMQIFGGTYTGQLNLTVSGTATAPISILAVPGQRVVLDGNGGSGSSIYAAANISHVTISDLNVTRNYECVLLRGSYITLNNLDVYNCRKFGYRITGTHITVSNSRCRDSVTENLGGNNTSGGWGSCLKTGPGSGSLVIRGNEIFHNWGEGLIVGQAAGAQVYDNVVHDNFSQNIYIGNAHDIDVYRNITYSMDPAYYRSGNPANCISSSEEFISDTWGAQLGNVRIFNNFANGCKTGVGYTYKEVAGNGCANCLIAYNTIVNSGGIKIIDGPKNSVIIKDNIVSGPISVPSSGVTVSSNFTGNPEFAGTPGTTAESFRLSSTSPARNIGVPIPGVTTDYWGTLRDATPDVGAHEYGGGAPTPTATSGKPGDANGDGRVDGVDYVIWLNHYNQNVSGASNGDFNNSGRVDGVDYVMWLNNYGT